ncbi:HAMP domain-containing histidine kinase [Maridesulfovibrio bastinii]|uniref:HAMP domain-containing histidine kinase n=1 Tax=Maridesulfovibrio bastinii TaxID=47157 RepID=UPI000427C820|nr:HAMP domain-containing histidine kinase [Maridesulfovibrio bastinii]
MITDDKSRKELKFFGTVSASVSHDLKNVFAIINEDAGLLEDLVLLAGKGVDLDPAKLSAVASKIQKQIQRGDRIVKNMNVFAHSVDENICNIDVGSTLELVYTLMKRKLSTKVVEVEFLADEKVTVTTDYFLFEMIAGHVLKTAINCAATGKITVRTGKDGDAAFVEIAQIIADSDYYDENILVEMIKAVDGELLFDKSSGVLKISLPGSLSI